MRLLSGFFRSGSQKRAEWFDGIKRAGAAAADRQLATARMSARSFEAAETPAYTDSWPTHASQINDTLQRQLPTLRARSRGLARNNEWAIGLLSQFDDNVLGPEGIQYQSRLEIDGNPDNARNALLERAWKDWGNAADVSGLDWRMVERMALRGLVVDGEILYRIRQGKGEFGIQVQMLDPGLLDVSLTKEHQGRRIRMGVEIDDDGFPIAYWLRMSKAGDAPSDYIAVGRHVRIPAGEIRHFFVPLEIGQLRGVPWLVGGARRLWLLKDFEEAAAVASSNAAKRQGFFVSPTGEAPKGFVDTYISAALDAAKAEGKTLTPDELAALQSAAEKFTTTVPGQFDVIPEGYDFRQYESKWPDVGAGEYIKQQLRGWATAQGASYVTLGNDLESVNYSSARVGILGEREHFKSIQRMMLSALHKPVMDAVLPHLVLMSPHLKPSALAEYQAAVTWQPRRWAGIDPVKEATAHQINLALGLTSRRRIILERGEDPDEIFAEAEAEQDIFGQVAPAPAESGHDESNDIPRNDGNFLGKNFRTNQGNSRP
jgi:lambda family phage portal protein